MSYNPTTHNTTTTAGTGPNILHHNQPVVPNTQQAAYTNPGAGTLPNSTALPAQGGYADPAYNTTGTGVTTGTGTGTGITGTGTGLTGGKVAGNTLGHRHGPTTGTTMSGASTAPHSSTGSGGAAMKSAVGQMEHAAGTVLCSRNLKTKGIIKEQEAAQQRQQNAHLNRAEMIEQEAQRERGMAVGAGAHPDQGHLGATGVGGGRTGVY